jgi:HlyD family secretion protein
MGTRSRLAIGAAAAVLAAALAWALAPRPIEVEAAGISVGHFETAIEEDGKTRLRDAYTVSAPLAGLLRRISLREGDPVAPGQPVAALQPAYAPLLDERSRREQQARLGAAQAQVRAADAALERSDIGLRRARQDEARSAGLAVGGFVAPSRLEADQLATQAAQRERDSAVAQRQIALHEVEQSRAALAATTSLTAPASPGTAATRADFIVRAPIGGRVTRVLQTSETAVSTGAPLLELGDPARLEVVAELLTADAMAAAPGTPVRIERWGGPPLKGVVRLVEPAAFTKISALGVEEQRVRVLIDILDRPPAPPGIAYRVTVRVVTLSRDRVRKIPVSALFPLAGVEGASAVYAIENGRARLRRVRLGARNDLDAWLEEGLGDAARVIVYPGAGVRDGVRVRERSVAPPP